ncbi:MAG: hypothetical protein SOW25_01945 [Helicobacter sp.]|nr:hypothetical protein [Helicobacteraceae bacterium]MDY3113073.1 hypothetical protein [Helicobacter sp.]
MSKNNQSWQKIYDDFYNAVLEFNNKNNILPIVYVEFFINNNSLVFEKFF